jgi:5-carboxymethyl-2-hydroxymuconate isomerase
MPHMVISYPEKQLPDLDMQQFCQDVWDVSFASGIFTKDSIKVRAHGFGFAVNADSDKPLIHLEARLFAGRTDDQKRSLIANLLEVMKRHAPEGVSLSVEAVDMQTKDYIKKP